ncbi:DUF3575 domain-containing protein [Chitinophaga sp. S165]|uniref:DUF3575 domain-containing protein n=1 Tax=Chitinophaga sp. S165 TaxID=2135462 RepID=UPI000D7128C4|nr:DUF3575 domain-containing protein [Chitinophaga sp. S165]
MKYLLLICYLFLLTGIVNAQDSSEKLFPAKPGFILNTPLTSLTEPEGGPSIGLEYRISEGLAIGIEGTAVLYEAFPFLYAQEYGKSGFRIKPEIKYFPAATRGKNGQLYFSLQGVYKQVRYTEVSEATGNSIRKERKVIAGSPNVGWQRYLDRSHRFILDMYLGLGVRHRKTEPDVWMGNQLYLGSRRIDVDGYDPHLAFGFKLGYRF